MDALGERESVHDWHPFYSSNCRLVFEEGRGKREEGRVLEGGVCTNQGHSYEDAQGAQKGALGLARQIRLLSVRRNQGRECEPHDGVRIRRLVRGRDGGEVGGTGNRERDESLKADAEFFFRRSENWRNVFDTSIGLVRGKDTKGNWREPFDPYRLGHGSNRDNDFTEGNAFQYTWHVMQNPQGLVNAMGGREAFVRKLDSLFVAPSKTEGMGEVLDVTGLIGQYVHGNEPSHHVIYFYPQVGHPEKAAERIREVFDKFYLAKPDGLCGNDDCGQMSAWYVFSAMGFYPFNPCGGEYVIGAPQVACAKLRVGGKVRGRRCEGEVFTVIARNFSRENKYVKSVTLNGKPVTDWKIRHADIMRGGELVFEMGR